jgi:hypothetical protein
MLGSSHDSQESHDFEANYSQRFSSENPMRAHVYIIHIYIYIGVMGVMGAGQLNQLLTGSHEHMLNGSHGSQRPPLPRVLPKPQDNEDKEARQCVTYETFWRCKDVKALIGATFFEPELTFGN